MKYYNKSVSLTIDIIKKEKIGYDNHIIVSSKELTEVFHYSRDFMTLKDYKLLTIKLNIPLQEIVLIVPGQEFYYI